MLCHVGLHLLFRVHAAQHGNSGDVGVRLVGDPLSEGSCLFLVCSAAVSRLAVKENDCVSVAAGREDTSRV